MNLYIQNICDGISDTLFESLVSFVAPEKLEKINNYKRKEDRWRSLVSDTLARYAIAKQLDIDPIDVTFEYNSYGKPYLKDHEDIFFNVSHSGDLVVCGVSDKPIGVDVEKRRSLNPKIADKFCTENEIEFLNSSKDPIGDMIRFWSLKESYIKALGTGLATSLKTITFDLHVNHVTSNAEGFKFNLYELFDDYIIAVCSVITSES